MKKINIFSWLISAALITMPLLVFPLPVFSQGCALCYTQAASAGTRMIQALKSGILILIVPPTLGSVGMLFIVHRKRNQVRRVERGAKVEQDW